MTFVALLLLDIGILLLYAAYLNKSPFEVIQAYLSPEKDTDNEQ